jgi:hypothetical protein
MNTSNPLWVRYTTIVSFIALLAAYSSSLVIGWSLARAVPGVAQTEQLALLARSLAIAIIAWPIWILHWRLAQRDWLWESSAAQKFLAFFTVVGLLASVFIGFQFVSGFIEFVLGTLEATLDAVSYLLGAAWSTLVSLWLWVYHGRIWIHHRRRGQRG